MTDKKSTETKVKEALAHHLGVEPEDLNLEDSLATDLHMRPSDISDFLGSLEEKEIDTSTIDLLQIDTVEELVEALTDSVYE
ncbi:hypothetical protein A2714_01795 [Candidatus Woesebacteria bacterium RIFCSPHIGHO2_01_FULL_38_9]|uniref:Carrier domain-containing protein n=2 Tax=Candidatus Woeseibacteriota TaxID=1752722 RepID=A0A1F7Y156_9BACT|nr:MAG: hypothetical protein A2714_01795 [Candidatus Woesebacteria bacterium RIFCSPHIGHO2_01_FULL_38_9]OGM58563.1 MAG: hypothetical protein A3A75_02485 [Candidatus Woesebacteria bacterium RIFCSPLOWO2_01_FULL_39_10]